ncbi:MAG: hypothetical protein IID03_12905 [Candidatus Dadabacteria bacterium]|nr:hypothetical protein [Candidatus Dadabacteria bacterium]
MGNKVKDLATHKYSIRSYITMGTMLLGYGGYQKVGAPKFEALIDHVIEVKNHQILYIEGVNDIKKNQKQIINELMIKLKEHVAPNKVKLISI